MNCHPIYTIQFILFYLALSMIKIHYIIRVLYTAISTWARHHSANQIPSPCVRTSIPVKVLSLVFFVVSASEFFTAFAAVRVTQSYLLLLEIKLGDWFFIQAF